jgi:replication factor A1
VKSWKGIPQLTFDQNATVKKLDKSKISTDKLQVKRMPLHELVEKRGALDVEIEGTVIEIRPGSGLVLRCPECNRVLMNEQCSIHGKVKGIPDLRVKMVVDDGTGAVGSVLNRELSEKILGTTLDECKKIDNNDLITDINNKLFARRILLHGNALGDDFGTNIITKDAKLIEMNVEKEAGRLSSELEGLI